MGYWGLPVLIDVYVQLISPSRAWSSYTREDDRDNLHSIHTNTYLHSKHSKAENHFDIWAQGGGGHVRLCLMLQQLGHTVPLSSLICKVLSITSAATLWEEYVRNVRRQKIHLHLCGRFPATHWLLYCFQPNSD